MNKRSLITLVTLLVIIAGAAVAAFLAKGYTFSPADGRVVGTGIISVTSLPEGAAVYIDGHLQSATNTTIPSLPPKKYQLRVAKEGFIPWEKEIEVSEGLVSHVKVTLFPALPTLYPLTYNGAINPILSPDGQRLAFAVPLQSDLPIRQKGGVWVWTMSNQPIAFNRGAEPRQIVEATELLDFTKANIAWSPDSKQLLVSLQEGGREGESYSRNYLLSVDQKTSISDLRDITPSLASVKNEWSDDAEAKKAARVEAIEDISLRKVASESALLKWSPDESKFMIASKDDLSPTPVRNRNIKISPTVVPEDQSLHAELGYKDFKVYALNTKVKEDDNTYRQPISGLTSESYKEYSLPLAKYYHWLPDSEHIILINDDKISVVDFDGTNEAIVYAGKFENSFVFPWPDSSKLVLMTTFATPTGLVPNLYGINLK